MSSNNGNQDSSEESIAAEVHTAMQLAEGRLMRLEEVCKVLADCLIEARPMDGVQAGRWADAIQAYRELVK